MSNDKEKKTVKKGAITYVLTEPRKKTIIKKGGIFYDLTPPNTEIKADHEREQYI
jgi:hypothetical protein